MVCYNWNTGRQVSQGQRMVNQHWRRFCSSNEGGGFCAYADITLCVKVTSNDSTLQIMKWLHAILIMRKVKLSISKVSDPALLVSVILL